jgi:Uma2 family endonuclease
VAEYWVVDPLRETVRVYRRGDTGLICDRSLSADAGDVIATPLLPGLAIPVTDLFR